MRIGDCARKMPFGRVSALIATALAVAGLAPPTRAAAATFDMLYSFCLQGGKNCTDGEVPLAEVIIDASGHLYGTTWSGGAHGKGTVFELKP